MLTTMSGGRMFNRVQGGNFHQFPASVGGKFTPDLPRTRTSQLTSASHQQGPSRDSPKRIHDAILEVPVCHGSIGFNLYPSFGTQGRRAGASPKLTVASHGYPLSVTIVSTSICRCAWYRTAMDYVNCNMKALVVLLTRSLCFKYRGSLASAFPTPQSGVVRGTIWRLIP